MATNTVDHFDRRKSSEKFACSDRLSSKAEVQKTRHCRRSIGGGWMEQQGAFCVDGAIMIRCFSFVASVLGIHTFIVIVSTHGYMYVST